MKSTYKRILWCLFFVCITITSSAQTINQIEILPVNPNSEDTILVITNFTYFGSCEDGMVYSVNSFSATDIQLYPTFCGYGLKTECTSIDTLKIGPFSSGVYTMSIVFHQGSICPISDFDATLAQFDTLITVDLATYVPKPSNDFIFNVFPNPVSEFLNIEIPDFSASASYLLIIYDVTGKEVFHNNISQPLTRVNIANLSLGVYSVSLVENGKNTKSVEQIVIQ